MLYALSLLGWAWAVAPLSRAAALATALVLLVTPTYAGLFHEVSSDPVFAFVLAWWAGRRRAGLDTGSTCLAGGRRRRRRAAHALPPGGAGRRSSRPCSCRSSPAAAGRPSCGASPSRSPPAILPLAAWAAHNAIRYDDLTVARGGKAWVPFFRVGGSVDPANGDAPRSVSPTPSSARCCRCRRTASRDVDVDTYFGGVGNLEVIRLIALSDRVFGWDDDYDVLFDASLEAIRADPEPLRRAGSPTRFWDFLSQRYSPEARERPVAVPRAADRARRSTAGRSRRRSPSRRSSRRCATGSSGARPTTSSAASCPIRRPRSGAPREGRRYTELVDTVRDWNAQLPTRDSHAWLAAKGGTAATAGPARSSGSRSRSSRSLVRRPRGIGPVVVLGVAAASVLLVHALSQAPQNEFALPFVPVWIVAALVGLLAPRARPA